MALILNGTGSGFNRSVINDNFQKIEDEINNNVLRRDAFGSEDNAMRIDLDMNNYRVLNLPKPESEFEPARLIDITNSIGGIDFTPKATEVEFTGNVDYAASNIEIALEKEAELRSANEVRISAVEGNLVSNNTELNILTSGVNVLQNEMVVVQQRSLGNLISISSLSSTKASRDIDAVVDNVAVFDSNGDPVDSGVSITDLGTSNTTSFVSETIPVDDVVSGSSWYKPSDASSYTYFDDGDSGQWVENTAFFATGASSALTSTALLESSTSFPAGYVIETSGFYASGDRQGGQWVKTSETDTPSQNCFELGKNAISDADGNVWYSLHQGTLSIASLGASPNDTSLDHGALINGTLSPSNTRRANIVEVPEGKYHVSTALKRYAGTSIRGVNRAYSVLYNDSRSVNGIAPAQEVENDTEGRLIGNGSGTYYGSLSDITLHNFNIGLNGVEDWWFDVKNVVVSSCNKGHQTGFGSSKVTGNYWCRFTNVRYIGNNVNLVVTDFTNLNVWTNCRFEGAVNQDVLFQEPTSPLDLGMENNKFSQCEFVSEGGIEFAARILGLTFDQCYFESTGSVVKDDNNLYTVRSVIFRECGFYGGSSLENKVRLGYGLSPCTHVKFDNCVTNVGIGSGGPATLHVFDMGPNAFWWTFDNPYLQNGTGVEFITPEETNKDKWQLRAENHKSIEFYEKTVAKKTISSYNSVQDETPQNGVNIKSQIASITKNIGTMPTDGSYVEVAVIDRFFLSSAYAFSNWKATFAGRNLTTPGHATAVFEVDVSSNGTSLVDETEITNRVYGTSSLGYRLRKSGDSLIFEINASTEDVDNASISLTVSCNGGSIGTAEEV